MTNIRKRDTSHHGQFHNGYANVYPRRRMAHHNQGYEGSERQLQRPPKVGLITGGGRGWR